MEKYKEEVGIVEKRLSRKTYLIKQANGESIQVHLKPVHKMNYLELSIGSKVYFELIPPKNKEGRLLTGTDFKLNN